MPPQPLGRFYSLLKSFFRHFHSKSAGGTSLCAPFKSRVVEGATNILARDAARAKKALAGLHPHGPTVFRERNMGDPITAEHSIDVTDAAVTYTMSIGVGQPAQIFNLLIDTGSSNTWIGAHTAYKPTSRSRNTGKQVNVTYGSGSFTGTEYLDTVTLGPDLVIPNQSIGVASSSQGFGGGIDGILGIGPVDLTMGTVSGSPSVPTVTDKLYSLGIIPTELIGISYVPTTQVGETANGELTFGAVDSAKYTGEIEYIPITQSSPANKYWGIDQSISYGDGTTILSMTAGIVDTGTTLLLLATDSFQAYQQATGAAIDSASGLLTITQAEYNNLQSLFFNIGSTTFELTANAQIWPRALNSIIGGDPNKIYLVVGDLGSNSGSGLDFINGFVFLQRFYSVYDITNNRVGMATTQYTNATSN
ncbi:hypothetical protein AX15_003786 [Amanita polypyramis BW_CC]|nr:hypothetical protein AX15_003786 [Amanita polypyramis BW_CC]